MKPLFPQEPLFFVFVFVFFFAYIHTYMPTTLLRVFPVASWVEYLGSPCVVGRLDESDLRIGDGPRVIFACLTFAVFPLPLPLPKGHLKA